MRNFQFNSRNMAISITPRKVFHPSIVNACQALITDQETSQPAKSIQHLQLLQIAEQRTHRIVNNICLNSKTVIHFSLETALFLYLDHSNLYNMDVPIRLYRCKACPNCYSEIYKGYSEKYKDNIMSGFSYSVFTLMYTLGQ